MSTRHKLPLDYPIGFRGLTLNNHRDSSGDLVRANLAKHYQVERFDFSALSVRDQLETLHLDSGADVGLGSKEFRRIALTGRVEADTAAKLEDAIAELFNAFDLEEALRDDPSTEGVSVLDFYTPSDSPPTGHTSPVREAFLARPRGFPVVFERMSRGLSALFAVELVAPDPRRYAYTAEAVTFSTGAGFAQSMPNWADGQGVVTFPVLTITMAGNGDSNLTVSDGTTSLVLDMSGAGSGTFTVDMFKADIKKATTPRADLRTSDVDTFYGVAPGGGTWTFTNTTNVTSVVAAYRQARS